MASDRPPASEPPATQPEQGGLARRLEEQEAYTRALFERSPIGMNLCRPDGLWIESNPAFLQIIGYSREEADGGLTYWELTPRDYDDAERTQLEALETTGRYGPYEKEFIRKDGRRVPVRLNGFMIEREGQRLIWSLIEDISQEHELATKLEQQRLQALQAAKLASVGEIAAGVAHEVNNPLQIIDGLAFTLQQAAAKGEPASADAVATIRAATDRAARIVRSLLKFARAPEEVRPHPARAVATEGLHYTAARMRSHGVEVRQVVHTERAVLCSALELTQVLVNLLNNAFDAVREERGEVVLTVEDDGPQVVFEVSDSGPGAPAELQDRIFEPFVTSKPQGTGLGLSLSRGIVEALGGTLRYSRDPRTRFTVRLPAAASP